MDGRARQRTAGALLRHGLRLTGWECIHVSSTVLACTEAPPVLETGDRPISSSQGCPALDSGPRATPEPVKS